MGALFKSAAEREKEEKIQEDLFIAKQGNHFCYVFTSQVKSLLAIRDDINKFLKNHPDFRIGSMFYAPELLGMASMLCYFEKIEPHIDLSPTVESVEDKALKKNIRTDGRKNKVEVRDDAITIHLKERPKEEFKCPNCGAYQQPNRDLCWQCKSVFVFDSDNEMGTEGE